MAEWDDVQRIALGDRAPSGPILAVRVEDLGVKEALLQADPETFFTTPHFDNYAAVLIRLDRISLDELNELIVEAWLCRAPKRLADEYLESEGGLRLRWRQEDFSGASWTRTGDFLGAIRGGHAQRRCLKHVDLQGFRDSFPSR